MENTKVIGKIMNYPRIPISFNPKVTPLEKIPDKRQIDIRYCLISPFAYAHIYLDAKISEVVYDI